MLEPEVKSKFCNSSIQPFYGYEGEYIMQLFDPIYRINIIVVVNSDQEKHDQIHQNFEINIDYEVKRKQGAHVYCFEPSGTNNGRPVIFNHYFGDQSDKVVLPGIIAHECLHIAEYIMEDVGIQHNEKTCEAWGYLLQWLVEEINYFIMNYEEIKARENSKESKDLDKFRI